MLCDTLCLSTNFKMASFVSISVLVFISVTSCQMAPQEIALGTDGTIAGGAAEDLSPEMCSRSTTQPTCQPNVHTAQAQTDSTVQILAELLSYVLRQGPNGSSCSGTG